MRHGLIRARVLSLSLPLKEQARALFRDIESMYLHGIAKLPRQIQHNDNDMCDSQCMNSAAAARGQPHQLPPPRQHSPLTTCQFWSPRQLYD